MCDRLSMTSTRRPSSLAARSATVSPKKPEPTTSRSTDTSTPLRMETTSNEPTVGDPANPDRDQPVTAAHDDVARVLQACSESDPAELPLQPQFRLQLPQAAAPGVGAIPDAVHDQRLGKVLHLRTSMDHPGKQPVVLHQADIDVPASLLHR